MRALATALVGQSKTLWKVEGYDTSKPSASLQYCSFFVHEVRGSPKPKPDFNGKKTEIAQQLQCSLPSLSDPSSESGRFGV